MSDDLPRGVRQRENGNYVVELVIDGKRKPKTVKTREEAIALKAMHEAGIALPPPPPPPKASAAVWHLGKLCEVALATPHREGGFAGQRARMFEDDHQPVLLRYFGEWFPIDQIRREPEDAEEDEDGRTIDGMVRALRAGELSLRGKPSKDITIDKIVGSLRKLLKLAVKKGTKSGLQALPEFPARLADVQYKVRFYSDEEEAALLEYRPYHYDIADHLWFADTMTVLIDTGARFGELAGIAKGDIDFKVGIIRIYGVDAQGGKTGVYRSVPMTKRVMEIMRRRSANGWEPFDYDYERVRYPFNLVRDELGLTKDPDFTIHTARHTCASRLVQRGVRLEVVKEWLGHKVFATTLRYAHLRPQNLLDVVHVLEPEAQGAADETAILAFLQANPERARELLAQARVR